MLSIMDADRARRLLEVERERIERALNRLGPVDDGEPADEFDPANQASDLYQDEFDEGLEEVFVPSSLRSSEPNSDSPLERTDSRSRADSRFPTNASRLCRPPS